MTVAERAPAEVFHLAEYLSEEIEARGWTTTDVAIRMGGVTDHEVARDLLTIDLLMCVHKDSLQMSDKTFDKIASAFDVSSEYLKSLDDTWRRWPERRTDFTPPEAIFGPVSRRALIRAVK